MELAEKPPVTDMATELGLVGSRMEQQGKVEQRVDLMKWSRREDEEGMGEGGGEGGT